MSSYLPEVFHTISPGAFGGSASNPLPGSMPERREEDEERKSGGDDWTLVLDDDFQQISKLIQDGVLSGISIPRLESSGAGSEASHFTFPGSPPSGQRTQEEVTSESLTEALVDPATKSSYDEGGNERMQRVQEASHSPEKSLSIVAAKEGFQDWPGEMRHTGAEGSGRGEDNEGGMMRFSLEEVPCVPSEEASMASSPHSLSFSFFTGGGDQGNSALVAGNGTGRRIFPQEISRPEVGETDLHTHPSNSAIGSVSSECIQTPYKESREIDEDLTTAIGGSPCSIATEGHESTQSNIMDSQRNMGVTGTSVPEGPVVDPGGCALDVEETCCASVTSVVSASDDRKTASTASRDVTNVQCSTDCGDVLGSTNRQDPNGRKKVGEGERETVGAMSELKSLRCRMATLEEQVTFWQERAKAAEKARQRFEEVMFQQAAQLAYLSDEVSEMLDEKEGLGNPAVDPVVGLRERMEAMTNRTESDIAVVTLEEAVQTFSGVVKDASTSGVLHGLPCNSSSTVNPVESLAMKVKPLMAATASETAVSDVVVKNKDEGVRERGWEPFNAEDVSRVTATMVAATAAAGAAESAAAAATAAKAAGVAAAEATGAAAVVRMGLDERRAWGVGRISFTSFALGELALFIPTPGGRFLAFNCGCPSHFLSDESQLLVGEDIHFREYYVLGRIVEIRDFVCEGPPSGPGANLYGAQEGSTIKLVSVTSIASEIDASSLGQTTTWS
ncbi:unnamed protein product [Choristocarpus tenellus]